MEGIVENEVLCEIDLGAFFYVEYINESYIYAAAYDIEKSKLNLLNEKLVYSTGRDWEYVFLLFINENFENFSKQIKFDSERILFSVSSKEKFKLLKVFLLFLSIESSVLENYLIEYNKKRCKTLFTSYKNKLPNVFLDFKEVVKCLNGFESDVKDFVNLGILKEYKLKNKKYFSRKEIESTLFSSNR
ncbi:hypothetical protein [Tenacibaculum aquimarinum]|uniref:hypothetical protein n=1 Tax=Tenacibaculum aquimarinum TaxID=2910675 RepID=UPI001F0B4EDB|nr:hypothetical protein [Tenacibaculum aquimarinum]MCH3885926.1 hypothetical protein [Tenacibaculum aquimarinum]